MPQVISCFWEYNTYIARRGITGCLLVIKSIKVEKHNTCNSVLPLNDLNYWYLECQLLWYF